LAIDNLVSADVVTANGEVVQASEQENPDLFWALRGGGGNFGVVTSFEFALHPVGPIVHGGLAAWPLPQGRDALDLFKRLTDSASDDLTTFMAFAPAPDGSGNMIAALVPIHIGPLDVAAREVQPIKDAHPMIDMLGPIPYTAQQSLLDAGFPAGLNVYWKSTFLRELPSAAMDVLFDQAQAIPQPTCAMVIEHFHGAVNRVPRQATAFTERGSAFNVAIIATWLESADADRCIAWARGVNDALQPWSTGSVYVNYLGVGDGVDRVREAYGDNYDRLAAAKQLYDPENLFRVNQNIRPHA
jgi:FAD/FMN-containing dehydrogenase